MVQCLWSKCVFRSGATLPSTWVPPPANAPAFVGWYDVKNRGIYTKHKDVFKGFCTYTLNKARVLGVVGH